MKQLFFLFTLILGFALNVQAAGSTISLPIKHTIIGKTASEPNTEKATLPKQNIFAKIKQALKRLSDTDTKTVALVSYLTLIGWLVAFIALKPYGDVGAFHLRNAIGIYVTSAAVGVVISILSFIFVLFPPIVFIFSLLGGIVYLFCFINWIIGIINAVNGVQKGALLFDKLYQKWFASIA